jgi:hypothetical protein
MSTDGQWHEQSGMVDKDRIYSLRNVARALNEPGETHNDEDRERREELDRDRVDNAFN